MVDAFAPAVAVFVFGQWQRLEEVVDLFQEVGDVEAGDVHDGVLGALEQCRAVVQGHVFFVEEDVFVALVVQQLQPVPPFAQGGDARR